MGSCFSSDSDYSVTPSTARVISTNGSLCEYPVPVTVSQVLEMESSSCFLCNSDRLYYDDYIPALDSGDQLEVGQIYFLLPKTRLQYRLTASDMAALAVKASTALANISKKGGRRRKKIQISPVMEVNQRVGDGGRLKTFEKPSIGISRSGSVRKLKRNASRRAKMTIRSFRVRLSTIYEGSVAD
ncbi:hypothetical protein HHK36_008860 [Tetracentron sinense]|uniref:Uncharacterized protein n=1 Tax=Tetracentron sinense TaxID=13715 RepID=A0A835DKC9_TETSI|nr:hypothetical protein HHK36_008860 [Tetracentron sinense]